MKRVGVAVILAAVLTTGISGCSYVHSEQAPTNQTIETTTAEPELEVINDSYRRNPDTGKLEFIQDKYDTSSTVDTSSTPNVTNTPNQ